MRLRSFLRSNWYPIIFLALFAAFVFQFSRIADGVQAVAKSVTSAQESVERMYRLLEPNFSVAN